MTTTTNPNNITDSNVSESGSSASIPSLTSMNQSSAEALTDSDCNNSSSGSEPESSGSDGPSISSLSGSSCQSAKQSDSESMLISSLSSDYKTPGNKAQAKDAGSSLEGDSKNQNNPKEALFASNRRPGAGTEDHSLSSGQPECEESKGGSESSEKAQESSCSSLTHSGDSKSLTKNDLQDRENSQGSCSSLSKSSESEKQFESNSDSSKENSSKSDSCSTLSKSSTPSNEEGKEFTTKNTALQSREKTNPSRPLLARAVASLKSLNRSVSAPRNSTDSKGHLPDEQVARRIPATSRSVASKRKVQAVPTEDTAGDFPNTSFTARSRSLRTNFSSHSSGSSTISSAPNRYQILGVGVLSSGSSKSSRSHTSGSTRSSASSFFYRVPYANGVGGFWLSCGVLIVILTVLTFAVAKAATEGASSILSTMSATMYGTSPLKVVVATRLHNRQATHPMTEDAVRHRIESFADICKMSDAVQGIIAVDAEDTNLIQQVNKEIGKLSTPMAALPITPWGRFVPALNALIGYAASLQTMPDVILFVSAETTATRQGIQVMLNQMLDHPDKGDSALPRLRASKVAETEEPKLSNSTLVVGALLQGHDYQKKAEREGSPEEKAIQKVELNGRTTPWNTLAVWNLRKLATTGFLLLSEGYLTSSDDEPSYGVEEVIAIALLQKLLGPDSAKAKLVPIPGVNWESDFSDPERRLWHQAKMESKLSRAARQMKIAKLTGVVHHY